MPRIINRMPYKVALRLDDFSLITLYGGGEQNIAPKDAGAYGIQAAVRKGLIFLCYQQSDGKEKLP